MSTASCLAVELGIVVDVSGPFRGFSRRRGGWVESGFLFSFRCLLEGGGFLAGVGVAIGSSSVRWKSVFLGVESTEEIFSESSGDKFLIATYGYCLF